MKNSSSRVGRQLVWGLCVFGVTTGALALTAHSLTFKKYIEEDGRQFWQIGVTCTDYSARRMIVRPGDDGPWCAKEVPDMCGEDRILAAIKVCSVEYADALAKKQDTDQLAAARAEAEKLERRSALVREQLELNQQLLEIEQKKLVLRTRDVELQRKELALRERLAQANQ
ncbi:MAG: hypothetical protein AAF431_10565 [Pseudomonadota bacterium]